MCLVRSILLFTALSSIACANDYDEKELEKSAMAPQQHWTPRTHNGYVPLPSDFDPDTYVLTHIPVRTKRPMGWYEWSVSSIYSWFNALWE